MSDLRLISSRALPNAKGLLNAKDLVNAKDLGLHGRVALALVVPPIFAVLFSVLTALILFSAYDIDVMEAFFIFAVEPVRDVYGISELILKVSPIVLCGLGLLFCFKAGVWNIGVEGQFILGAIAAGWAALSLDAWPSQFASIAVLVMGIAGGVFWASLAAALKNTFGANEILTTIMMNYIALHFLMYLVNGPLKDPSGFNFPESAIFAEHTLLPQLHPDYRVNVSIFISVSLSLVVLFVLGKTRLGFDISVRGSSQSVAKNAGIRESRLTLLVLGICGGFAGLAGAAEVAGPVQQLIPQLSLGYGYAAIIAIYLGRMHPLGLILASILLGIIYVGSENLQVQYQLPSSVLFIFQGLILFYLLGTDYLMRRFVSEPGRVS